MLPLQWLAARENLQGVVHHPFWQLEALLGTQELKGPWSGSPAGNVYISCHRYSSKGPCRSASMESLCGSTICAISHSGKMFVDTWALTWGFFKMVDERKRYRAASICIKLKCWKYRGTCLIRIKEGCLPNHAFDTSHSSNGLHVSYIIRKCNISMRLQRNLHQNNLNVTQKWVWS
jgi:hypothetical protein